MSSTPEFVEPSEEEIVEFLEQMLAEFSRTGWGQPGSLLEFGAQGQIKHLVNGAIIDATDFVRSFLPSPWAQGLMLHWEYWPPAELIEKDERAELYRALLWADLTGREIAIMSGSESDACLIVSEAFPEELSLMTQCLKQASGLRVG